MRKLKCNLALIFIVIISCSCSNSEPKIEPVFNLQPADFHNQLDYEIYNFILEQNYSDSSLVIIRQRVNYNLPPIIYYSNYSSDNIYIYVKQNMPKVDTTAYINFISINDSISYLDNLFKLKKSTVKLISESEYDYFFDKGHDTWVYFFNKYPKSAGLIELSRIGFNKEITQALIEVWYSKGWTGSRAYLYFLEKENNNWIITDKILTRTNF